MVLYPQEMVVNSGTGCMAVQEAALATDSSSCSLFLIVVLAVLNFACIGEKP